MIIDVLQLGEDGAQTLRQREVPDDYFPPAPKPAADYYAMMEGIMEGFTNG